MIEFAKEVPIGKRVHVKYADKKKEYICEHCGVRLSPVQGTEREWSYRCVDVLHKRSVCAQMTHKTNYIYNADQMDPACFFDGLFRVENGSLRVLGDRRHRLVLLLVEVVVRIPLKLFRAER